MKFHFYLKSYGNSDDYSYQRNLCFVWEWNFIYDFSSNGQILVTGDASILNRCDKLPSSSTLYALSVTILLLVLWYQFLLFKAMIRQLLILYEIKSTIAGMEEDNLSHRKKSVSFSRKPSQDSLLGMDLRESLASLISQKPTDQHSVASEKDADDEVVSDEDEAEHSTELTHLVRNRLSDLGLSRKSTNTSGRGGGNGLFPDRFAQLSGKTNHCLTDFRLFSDRNWS